LPYSSEELSAMTLDEEMDWEDYQGFPRPTRQPYKCPKCGISINTREIYLSHRETCKGEKNQPTKTAFELEREKQLEESLRKFKETHGIR